MTTKTPRQLTQEPKFKVSTKNRRRPMHLTGHAIDFKQFAELVWHEIQMRDLTYTWIAEKTGWKPGKGRSGQGVSPATVSAIVNCPESIHREYRSLILVANAIGYRVEVVAGE